MIKQDIFSKTRLPDLQYRLSESFTNKSPNKIYKRACDILKYELQNTDDRGSEVVRKHLDKNILPGFACYKALIEVGIPKEQAVNFVQEEMCKSAQKMGDLCEKLSTKSYVYSLFYFLFGMVMKFGYPKEGWKIEKVEKSKKRIRFNMNSCLYFEELQKRGVSELCIAFCKTDNIAYDPLAPNVVFIRENTIANGADHCDFCFENGQLKNKLR
jgi:hypothetical protein